MHLAQTLDDEELWEECSQSIAIFCGCGLSTQTPAIAWGFCFRVKKCFAEATAEFQTVINLQPDRAGAYHNMGLVFAEQDQLTDAVSFFEKAISCDPRHAEAHKGKGITLLKLGQFDVGWEEYEWRWRCKDLSPHDSPLPLWDGSSLAGKSILLRCEQGFGDCLQFIRFAPARKAHGGTVLLDAPAPWPGFSAPARASIGSFREALSLPPCDVQAPLLSLPRILRTSIASMANDVR